MSPAEVITVRMPGFVPVTIGRLATGEVVVPTYESFATDEWILTRSRAVRRTGSSRVERGWRPLHPLNDDLPARAAAQIGWV